MSAALRIATADAEQADFALPVDQHGVRNSIDHVELLKLAVGDIGHRVPQFVVLDEMHHGVALRLWLWGGSALDSARLLIPAVFVVASYADDLQALVGKIIVPLAQVRKGRDAWAAPHGEEIQEYDLSLERCRR